MAAKPDALSLHNDKKTMYFLEFHGKKMKEEVYDRGRKPFRNKKRITLTVNGKKVDADINHRMTLAEFMREELDLTGTKASCNPGECGSCTVILDGMAVYSCTVLAIEATGKEVISIEGLRSEKELHPLQQTYIEHDALQCGYCTPGMILSLEALLQKNPQPTSDDVRNAIDGNLYRCGCYPNIIEGTLDVSAKMFKKGEG
jgi:aerobic-type carbon monoxide dehydrogenase small subunit (CoxS/CutS family)